MENHNIPKTRADALRIGRRHYFTGIQCLRGHVDKRYSKDAGCMGCRREDTAKFNKKLREQFPERLQDEKRKHYLSRKDHIKARVKAYADANKEMVNEKARQYAATHRAEARARAIAWRMANPDRKKYSDKAWVAANPAKVRAIRAARRAALHNACPEWAREQYAWNFQRIYEMAVEKSQEEGISYEVDHIVPLRGKTVCGLHLPWNLRIITSQQNNRRPRIWATQ